MTTINLEVKAHGNLIVVDIDELDEMAQDVIQSLMGDLETGSHHFNNEASATFNSEYPEMMKSFNKLVRRISDLASEAAQESELRDGLEMAINRIEDMLQGDDGQAWKEAEKWLPRLKQTLADNSVKGTF
jgi:hypothetical protein